MQSMVYPRFFKSPFKTAFKVGAMTLASLGICVTAAVAQTSDVVDRSRLRVCADPANLPFSSRDKDGFENKIAGLLGEKLNLPVVYTWFPQATGFVRRTLAEKRCDLIMGYAQGHELVQNTNHYYRSSYVMIVRKDGALKGIKNLDDPRLKTSRIGVVAGTPPATVLALNSLLTQVDGYKLTVDRRHEAPAEKMVSDLADGKIDIALAWGPIGGFFAHKYGKDDFDVIPMSRETKGPRMAYRITFGLRRGEPDWKHKLNDLIIENQAEINRILISYGVPILDEQGDLITP